MNTQTLQIKVFGDEAKAVKKGDIFIPYFDSVEGHDVVTLVRNNSIPELLDKYDHSSISLDQIIKYLRDITKEEQVL